MSFSEEFLSKKLNWVKNKFCIGYRGKSSRQTNVRINQFTIIYLQQNTMTGLTDDVIFKWNTDCRIAPPENRDIKTFIEIVSWLHFIQCSGANMSLPTFKHEYRLAHSNKLVWFVIFTPAEVLHLLLLLPRTLWLNHLYWKYYNTNIFTRRCIFLGSRPALAGLLVILQNMILTDGTDP